MHSNAAASCKTLAHRSLIYVAQKVLRRRGFSFIFQIPFFFPMLVSLLSFGGKALGFGGESWTIHLFM